MVRKGERAGKRGSKKKEKGDRKGDNGERSGEEVEPLELSPSTLAHTSVRIS